MALKLYTSANTITSGYSVATVRGAWDDSANQLGVRRLRENLSDAGTNSIRSNTVNSTTANWDVLCATFQSDPLQSDGAIEGTVEWVIGFRESNTNLNGFTHIHIWVTQGDTDTSRGTLLADYADTGSEFTTATPGVGIGLGPVSVSKVNALAGDRIIVEVGYRASSALTTYTGSLYRGGTGAELTNGGDASVGCGWLSFSGINADYTIPSAAPGPKFVDITTYSPTTDALTHTVPIPAGSVGDALVLFVDTGSGSATISANKGFVPFEAEIGTTMQARAFGKIADGTEGSSLTVTLSTTYTICAAVVRYSNVNTSGNFWRDFGSVASSIVSATAPTRPALSGTQSTDMVVGCWLPQDANKGAVVPSQSSGGWTVRAAVGHPSGAAKDTCGLLVMDSLGATNNPSVGNGNANSQWVVYDLSIMQPKLGSLMPFFGM